MKKLDQLITDFLEYLEIERGRSNRTIRNYDFYLRRFSDFAKNPSPKDVTRDKIHEYRLRLNRMEGGRKREQLSKSTQNYHLIALRSFLKYLARQAVESLPSEQIELAKTPMRQVEFLEVDELDRLLKAPDRTAAGMIALRDKAILELLFSTGLRVSELSNLKIEHVNLKRDEFTIRGKGGKTRLVFLSSTAKDAIKSYFDKRRDASPFIFVSHDRAKHGREESGPLLLDLFKEWLSDMQPRLALQNTSLRTRFVTPSQQIYFSPVQTFDPCNPCSVTQASQPHRFIHTLPTTR